MLNPNTTLAETMVILLGLTKIQQPVVLAPSVKIDTTKKVLFLEKVLSKIIAGLTGVGETVIEEISTTTTSTTSTSIVKKADLGISLEELTELLFFGNKFAIGKEPNSSIGWIANGKTGAYATSKPTIKGLAFARIAEVFRKLMLAGMKQLAATPEEKGYEATWREIYRTNSAKTLMNPIIASAFYQEHGVRRIFMTRGFDKIAPFSLCMFVYKQGTMVILKNINHVKQFIDMNSMTISPENKPKVWNSFADGTSPKRFADLENSTPQKFTNDAFFEFGIHMDPLKIASNSVFFDPSLALDKWKQEEELCTTISNIHATVNAITGRSFCTKYDYGKLYDERKSGDNGDIRKVLKLLGMMKNAIDSCNPEQKVKFLSRPVPKSTKVGDLATTGVSLL